MNLTTGNLFIDTGFSQCCHFQEKACGDAVAFKRIPAEERLLAVLAVWIGPFLRMGAQYLVWKGATALCGLFAPKRLTGVVRDFSTAMGLLLAMLGTVCLFWLVSTVCFLKGVGG